MSQVWACDLGLGPGSGFKMRPFLQLCVGMYAGSNKERLKGYILHQSALKID